MHECRVDYLIDAAAHIVHNLGRKDVPLLLMGAGLQYARLVKQCDRRGLRACVDMPGGVSNEFLFMAFRTIDLGVAWDRRTCTMNKVLEYMTLGRPEVTFDAKKGRVSGSPASEYVTENSPAKLAAASDVRLRDQRPPEGMVAVGTERI